MGGFLFSLSPLNPSPFTFTVSAGTPTEVRWFGLGPGDHGDERPREQVDVLCDHDGPDGGKAETFAVDLRKGSSPDRIILARIGRSGTLADALSDLRTRIAASPPAGYQRQLGPNDTLPVPEMNRGVDHRFRELEGRDKVLLDGPVSVHYRIPPARWSASASIAAASDSPRSRRSSTSRRPGTSASTART